MAKAVNQRINIYIDNTEAERALEKLKTRSKQLETEIDRIRQSGGNATKSMQRLAQTKSQIKSLEKNLKSGVNRSLRDMQGELRRVRAQLKRATDPKDINRLNKRWQALKKETDEYRRSLYRVDKEQSKMKGLFGSIGGNLKGALFFGGIAGAVTAATGAVIRLTKESFNLALQAQGVENAFKKLGKPELLDELRKATKGTVSDLELMKNAVNASNFKIPLKNLATYLKFAQQRARATGESVDYLVSSIVTGIARQSPMILDNLGLSITDIREEMKKTGDMAQAVGNIIQRSFQKTGDSADLVANKVDKIAAKAKNLQVLWGKFWTRMSAVVYDVGKALYSLHIDRSAESVDTYLKNYNKTRARIRDGINAQAEALKKMRGEQNKSKETLKQLNQEMKNYQQELKLLPIGSSAFTETMDKIAKLQQRIATIMGKDGNKKNSKIKSDQQKLAKDLEQINDDLTHYFDNEIQKRLKAIEDKYDKEAELAHGNAALLKQIEKTKAREISIMWQEDLQKRVKAMRQAMASFVGGTKNGRVEEVTPEDVSLVGPEQAPGTFGTGRGRDKKKPNEKYIQKMRMLNDYLGQATSAYMVFDQFLYNREQKELQQVTRINNKKKSKLDKRLKYGLITQQQYNRKVKKLDEEAEKKKYALKKKAFNRQKQIQAAQTISAGAQAVIRTFANAGGFPAGIAPAAIMTGITLAKVALIESQKAPKYGKGGSLRGPKHSSASQGMPVTNPDTGEVQAYMEGGEGILKASAMSDRKTYRVIGTPSQIASALNGSHGGINWEAGATLQPQWMNDPIQHINYNKVQASPRRYAEGGVYEKRNNERQSKEESAMLDLIKEQNNLMRQQIQQLSVPTRAVVSLSDLDSQQKRRQAILEDATMRR